MEELIGGDDRNLLSPQELAVLEGHSRHERVPDIASNLRISRNTVKTLIIRAKTKLSIESDSRDLRYTKLVTEAMRRGFLA
jgi:DNA-binding NarL/FixJ family response regulator